jgi:serine/threonine protein kinase
MSQTLTNSNGYFQGPWLEGMLWIDKHLPNVPLRERLPPEQRIALAAASAPANALPTIARASEPADSSVVRIHPKPPTPAAPALRANADPTRLVVHTNPNAPLPAAARPVGPVIPARAVAFPAAPGPQERRNATHYVVEDEPVIGPGPTSARAIDPLDAPPQPKPTAAPVVVEATPVAKPAAKPLRSEPVGVNNTNYWELPINPAPDPAVWVRGNHPKLETDNPATAFYAKRNADAPDARFDIPNAPALTQADLNAPHAPRTAAAPASASAPAKPAAPLTHDEWQRQADLRKYKLGKEINSGNFGSVNWLDGEAGRPPLVMKIAKNTSSLADLQREQEVYEKVGDHPNVARSLGVYTVDGKTGLVMEGIAGTSTKSVMSKMQALRNGDKQALKDAGMDRALTEAQYVGVMQYITEQTLQGVQHLESRGVVHNDIRPDNIMCEAETGQIKLVDFGQAMDSAKPPPENLQSPFGHGSVSPDLLKFEDNITSKHDVFAAGALVRQGLEGAPFRYNNNDPNAVITGVDMFKFGTPDPQTKRSAQTAMQKMAPKNAPAAAAANAGDKQAHLAAIRGRIEALLSDSFIRNTDASRDLQAVLAKAESLSGSADKAEEFAKALAVAEGRVAYAETHLKTSGTYAEPRPKSGGGAAVKNLQYPAFVNAMMNPNRDERPSAKDALSQDFVTDPAIDPEAARALLKQVLSGSGSASSGDAGGLTVVIEQYSAAAGSPASASASAPASASAATGGAGGGDTSYATLEDQGQNGAVDNGASASPSQPATSASSGGAAKADTTYSTVE